MKKYIVALLSVMGAALLSAGLAACAKKEEQHNWDTEWKHNAEGHWHICLNDGCYERGDLTAHDWKLTEDISTPPTCYEKGEGVYACTVCGEKKTDEIPPTEEHDFASSAWKTDDPDVHYRKCATPGCQAVEREAHVAGESQLVLGAQPYRNGRRETRCTICDGLLRTEVVPASQVPLSFTVDIQKRSGGKWKSSDIQPVVVWDDEPIKDGDIWVTRGRTKLVKSDSGNIDYGYVYTYPKGRTERGSLVDVFDYNDSAEAGVERELVDPVTGATEKLNMNNTSKVTGYGGYLTMWERGNFIIRFTFFAATDEVSRMELEIECVSYNEWSAAPNPAGAASAASLPVAVLPEHIKKQKT